MNHDELCEQIKVTCVSVNAFREAINKIENELVDINKKIKCMLETPICMPSHFLEKQARDAWQTGMENRFNNLIYDLHDWKDKVKESLEENKKYIDTQILQAQIKSIDDLNDSSNGYIQRIGHLGRALEEVRNENTMLRKHIDLLTRQIQAYQSRSIHVVTEGVGGYGKDNFCFVPPLTEPEFQKKKAGIDRYGNEVPIVE